MKTFLNFIFLPVGTFLLPYIFAWHERPTKEYTSYRRYPLCSPSDDIRFPQCIEDVVSIVKEAITRGVNVKALGSRHSQTDIICTEGIPIDMSRLNSREMNSDNVRANFGAGITLYEAGEFLRQNGRAFRTTPAYGDITLGGAIGTGAHGSTLIYNSSISSQVIKMTVVDGRGKVVEIFNQIDLKAFKVNLGLLGIVVDITVDTVPLYKILAHNYVTSDKVLTNGVAVEWAKCTDQITFHWFPAFNEVVVANLTFVSVDNYGTARTNAIVPSTNDSFNLLGTKVKEIAMELTSSECSAASTLGFTILHAIEFLNELSLWIQTPGFVPIHTEDGLLVSNPAIGYPQPMFSPVCIEVSTNVLGEACSWAHGHKNSNITILDNEDSVHVEFYLWKRNDPYNDASSSLAGYQTILQTLAKRFKARAHWGKCGLIYHSREMLDLKLDTTARRHFVDAMKKFDPNQIFINNFGRRLLKTGTEIDIDPLTTRCALLDNCFCSSDLDCGEGQICTTLPGYNSYPVCETKNVVPETKIDKKLFSTPLGVGDFLVNTVPTVAAAVISKCTVPKVLKTVTGIVGPLLG